MTTEWIPTELPRVHIERPTNWVALVGFMGTGKSRIGWELSRQLALNFIDTDKLIERIAGLPIPLIFEKYGEATFRRYEEIAVEQAVKLDLFVIACGGGTFINPKNQERLLARGPVIALSASPEMIYKRTRRRPRVLLQVPDPIQRIKELLATRQVAYDRAPIQVSTDGRESEDVVEEVIEKLWIWANQHKI